MSATWSARSMASTTQRRCEAMRAARRLAGVVAIAMESVGTPTGAVGTADRYRGAAPRGKSSESRILLKNSILPLMAWGLHYSSQTHCFTPLRNRRSKMKKVKSQQSGFTLVEIAIVLVIIGLLLGGILKGQELINSAKVKNIANDFRVIPTYIYAYQDKFKALPGDDCLAGTHVGAPATDSGPPCAAPAGNGVINGNWNSATTTDES